MLSNELVGTLGPNQGIDQNDQSFACFNRPYPDKNDLLDVTVLFSIYRDFARNSILGDVYACFIVYFFKSLFILGGCRQQYIRTSQGLPHTVTKPELEEVYDCPEYKFCLT